MRTPYLIIVNNKESFLYTDKRKVKKFFNENNVRVYFFKTIDKYNRWGDVFELLRADTEVPVDMFENNGCTYSKLGCYIMESLAKAKWNSSIKYPNNGWSICSICGDITNEIGECCYCGESVCWDCSHGIGNDEWSSDKFCSYECYRKDMENTYGISYNPEEEYKEDVLNRLDNILGYFDKNEIINILIFIDELEENLEYEKLSKDELLNRLNTKNNEDIYTALMELYEDKTDEELDFILDGEAFINNLDPNDPADQWFFED